MFLKFNDYNLGYRIVSLAFDEETKEKLVNSCLPTLYVRESDAILYPDEMAICASEDVYWDLKTYDNYDVIEIWENGLAFRRYSDKAGDNYFFITGACNSNCIMCPSPEGSRRKPEATSMEYLYTMANHIPSDTPHLTITGGEPFLIGEKIFPFLNYLKNKFVNTEFLFLTNGRIFAVKKYFELLKETIPEHSIVAIPIHGSCPEIHNSITRADKSFEQTKAGIKNLLRAGIRVEIRVVLSNLNIANFGQIADLIINEFKGVEYVSIIAMEMTGNARVNSNEVWIPYSEAFSKAAPGVRQLIENAVDVRLYNFPLCTVDSAYWSLCEKSISENKVRYDDKCFDCKYKKNCGGVFAGTLQMVKDELKPIL